jgi:flagellar basal body rod protein FlgG
LIKLGDNLLGFAEGRDGRRPVDDAVLRSRYIEASGVDPIKTLMDLVAATKAVAANGNLIRYQDSIMDRAVNVLGRVQA